MSVTVLYDDNSATLNSARSDAEHLWLTPADMQRASGWKLETQGLCRGDACVRTEQRWLDQDGNIDLAAFARHMGQPVVREGDRVWAFGESLSNRHDSMYSLEAPDFTLPDIDGKLHSLSDYRGKKVYLYSWGSY